LSKLGPFKRSFFGLESPPPRNVPDQLPQTSLDPPSLLLFFSLASKDILFFLPKFLTSSPWPPFPLYLPPLWRSLCYDFNCRLILSLSCTCPYPEKHEFAHSFLFVLDAPRTSQMSWPLSISPPPQPPDRIDSRQSNFWSPILVFFALFGFLPEKKFPHEFFSIGPSSVSDFQALLNPIYHFLIRYPSRSAPLSLTKEGVIVHWPILTDLSPVLDFNK